MRTHFVRARSAVLLTAFCPFAQNVEPFPQPINTTADVIRIGRVDFATTPSPDKEPPRMMRMLNEPGTRRLFASDMRGVLYSMGYDGKSVTKCLDLTASKVTYPIVEYDHRDPLLTSGRAAVTEEKTPGAARADLGFGTGPDNRLFLLNKADGIIRDVVR